MKIPDQLYFTHNATDEELLELLSTAEYDEMLFVRADQTRRAIYGTDVYIRGLIEFTNYCRNNCYYCGIRGENRNIVRYRLTKEEILSCCERGYALGFRTFVLQGGEDGFFTEEKLCEIVREIHEKYPDCCVTLSVGEWEKDSYEAFYQAGARRFLLRQETANSELYAKLHPKNMSLTHRKQCLFDLKEIGYQVGAGFLVEPPFHRLEDSLADLRFLQELQPDMIGIGPFLSQKDTPFREKDSGTLEMTLRLVAILRLLFPNALIPATTALNTIHPKGRELGLRAGANVIMPNLTPKGVRERYVLYDHKKCTGSEAAEALDALKREVEEIGYKIVTDIGNVKRQKN